MRNGIVGLLVCCAVSIPASAYAENRTWQEGDRTYIQQGHCVVVEQECPDSNLRAAPPSPHHLLYLNRCRGGTTFTRSDHDDARLHESTVPRTGDWTLSEFPFGDEVWNQVVGHVRGFYAPFNIRVTDVDPGNVPHGEVAICGSGAEADYPDNSPENGAVLGISPRRCEVIPYGISFVFPVDCEWFAHDLALLIGETAAHEAGHQLGLDHELLCEDLMSYDCGEQEEGFVDEDSSCVWYDDNLAPQETDCSCDPPEAQNSFQWLLEAFGEGSAPTMPSVQITSPTYNQLVEPHFAIQFTMDDPYFSISQVELWVDDENIYTLNNKPYVLNGPDELAPGAHEVTVKVTNMFGVGSDTIWVVSGTPCGSDQECAIGEGCVEGRCVDGPEMTGGLGTVCTSAEDCTSGLCANDGVERRCIEICDPAQQGCPTGFDCRHVGEDDGGCWPATEIVEPGGCRASRDHSAPWLPILVSLLFSFVILRGRRRD